MGFFRDFFLWIHHIWCVIVATAGLESELVFLGKFLFLGYVAAALSLYPQQSLGFVAAATLDSWLYGAAADDGVDVFVGGCSMGFACC